MIGTREYLVPRFRVATARRTEDDPIVQNGLAITPSEMQEMMARGEAISAQHMQAIKEETPAQRNDFYVPMEHTRGFDMVDAWNVRHEVQGKVRELRNKVKNGEIQQMAVEE